MLDKALVGPSRIPDLVVVVVVVVVVVDDVVGVGWGSYMHRLSLATVTHQQPGPQKIRPTRIGVRVEG
jgi:hypothetical protein